MKRIDGYLELDNCKVVEAEKKGHYWVVIDGCEYYFKPTDYSYQELVSYQAAKFLGIEACFCDLAELHGVRGIISKSLRSDGVKLVSGDIILNEYIASSVDFINKMKFREVEYNKVKGKNFDEFDYYSDDINNLEIIWQALEYRYGERINIEEVMGQFVLMYLFTILFKEVDKHPGNWFVEESADGIKLGPLLDNEYTFGYYSCEEVSFSTNFDDYYAVLYESLWVFFKISASEYFDLFVEKFKKIRNNFDNVIKLVEKQIGMEIPFTEKNKIILEFNKNSYYIEDVIDRFKEKKQR